MDAHPNHEDAFDNTKLLIGPFERLRCVKKPHLMGIYQDEKFVNIYCRRRSPHYRCRNNCVPPPLPDPVPILVSGTSVFDRVDTNWEHKLSLEAPSTMTPNSPLMKLFVEFQELHKLTVAMPNVARHVSAFCIVPEWLGSVGISPSFGSWLLNIWCVGVTICSFKDCKGWR